MSTSPSRQAVGMGALAVAVAVAGVVAGVVYVSQANSEEGEPPAAETEVAAGVRKSMGDGEGESVSDARVLGTVVDERGQGVSGAQVCAQVQAGPRMTQLERLVRRCTRSDDRGRFSLGELTAAAYVVDASAPGRIPASDRALATPDPQARSLELVLRPGGVPIRGQIRDLTGGELGGAWVFVGGRGGGRADEDGTFEVYGPPGDVYITARAAGYVSGGGKFVAPAEDIEVFLAPEAVIQGRVVDADSGEGVAGVEVRANLLTNAYNFAYSEAYGAVTVSQDDGSFEVGSLAAGRFELLVNDAEAFGRSEGSVGTRMGQTTGPVELAVHMRQGTRFAGHLVDAETGEAVEGCQLELNRYSERLDDGYVKTYPDGRFEGRYPAGDYEPHLDLGCSTHHIPYGSIALTLGEREQLDLVFAAQAAALISGRVVDGAGEPFGEGNVQVRSETRFTSTSVRFDGSYELTGLPSGPYTLFAESSAATQKSESRTIELDVGQQLEEVEIEMPRGAVLRGELRDQRGDPIGTAQVSAVGTETRAGTTDRYGAFVIKGLAPGPYNVGAATVEGGKLKGANGGDEVLATVEVGESDERLDPLSLVVEQASGEIRGTVVDDDGPVADAYIKVEREGADGARTTSLIWSEQPSVTDVDGTFVVERLPAGNYTVRAFRKDGTEGETNEVETGSTTTVRIVPGAEMSGTALASDGTPLDDFLIIMKQSGGEGFRRESFFRTEGAWRIEAVDPGAWSLTLRAHGRQVDSETTVEAGVDRTGVELSLTPGVEIRGTVIDAESGAAIEGVRVCAEGMRCVESGADGGYVLEDVSSGNVTLTGSTSHSFNEPGDYHRARTTITVDAELGVSGQELVMVKRRLKEGQNPGDLGFGFEGRGAEPTQVARVRSEGPAASAGLAVGDIVTRINGRSVGSNVDLARTLLLVPEGTVVELTVEGREQPLSLTATTPR